MKKFLLLSLLLYGCSPAALQIADDFIEGEATVAEKIAQDLAQPVPAQNSQRPKVQIKVPVKKF